MYEIKKTHRSFFGAIALMDVEVKCEWCEDRRTYTVEHSQYGVDKAKEQMRADHTYRQHLVELSVG